jgi:hypothetical protein
MDMTSCSENSLYARTFSDSSGRPTIQQWAATAIGVSYPEMNAEKVRRGLRAAHNPPSPTLRAE